MDARCVLAAFSASSPLQAAAGCAVFFENPDKRIITSKSKKALFCRINNPSPHSPIYIISKEQPYLIIILFFLESWEI
jgi:hypothetical protein